MKTIVTSFLLLTLIVGVSNAIRAEIPSATLTADSILVEHQLDARTLTINLSEEEFEDYSILQLSDFTLVNAPMGLSMESVTGISPTQVEIKLSFDGTDFDLAYTNFAVGINSSVLRQTSLGVLYTNALPIYAYLETPIAILSADSILTEQRLDARSLTIDLSEEMFVDYTSLDASDFSLMNAPTGLTIGSVIAIYPTRVEIDLAFDGTDFDEDIPDFRLVIPSGILIQTPTGVLPTNNLTLFAQVELLPVATLSSDSVLTEYRLDARVLTIDLAEEMFVDYTSLDTSDFSLLNAPAGLTIYSVTGMSPTEVKIDLIYDGQDFDIPIPNFVVSISSSVLKQTMTGSLPTNPLIIFPYLETPSAILTSDSLLTEYWLDARVLTIDLSEEMFVDYTFLDTSDFSLMNAPPGLRIESATGISPYEAIIDLAFDGTDFDEDFPDFAVAITSSILYQTGSGVLMSNPLNINSTSEESQKGTITSNNMGNNQKGISIYPNPANDLLTIETNNSGQQSIEIFSLNGQLLYTTKLEEPTLQIDLSSFQKGLYFITIRSRDQVWTEKIIKL